MACGMCGEVLRGRPAVDDHQAHSCALAPLKNSIREVCNASDEVAMAYTRAHTLCYQVRLDDDSTALAVVSDVPEHFRGGVPGGGPGGGGSGPKLLGPIPLNSPHFHLSIF